MNLRSAISDIQPISKVMRKILESNASVFTGSTLKCLETLRTVQIERLQAACGAERRPARFESSQCCGRSRLADAAS